MNERGRSSEWHYTAWERWRLGERCELEDLNYYKAIQINPQGRDLQESRNMPRRSSSFRDIPFLNVQG